MRIGKRHYYQSPLKILRIISITLGVVFILIATHKLEAHTAYNHLNKNMPVCRYLSSNKVPLDTIYYNLKGKEVKRIALGGPDVIKLVLTSKSHEDIINDFIENNATINMITKDQVAKIDQIFNSYKTSNENKEIREQGFLISQTNKATHIVIGSKCDQISGKDWQCAINELVVNREKIASEVHSHPLKCHEESYDIGILKPSESDLKNAVTFKHTQPSMILSYLEIVPRRNPNKLSNSAPKPEYVPAIVFYNSKETFKPIPWQRLKNIIDAINNMYL